MCDTNEECVSSETLDCRCKLGFELNGTDSCEDTDECLNNQEGCRFTRLLMKINLIVVQEAINSGFVPFIIH